MLTLQSCWFPHCDCEMQLVNSYVPSHYLAMRPRDAHHSLQQLSGWSARLDHGGAWVQIPPGARKLFSELIFWT